MAARWSIKRRVGAPIITRLAVIGQHRCDMAHNTCAVIERLLQALLGVLIDDRRPSGYRSERDRAVVDLALVTANHSSRIRRAPESSRGVNCAGCG